MNIAPPEFSALDVTAIVRPFGIAAMVRIWDPSRICAVPVHDVDGVGVVPVRLKQDRFAIR